MDIIYCGTPGLQAQVLATYLGKLGHAVSSVENAHELLSSVRAAPPAFVILALEETPPALVRLARHLLPDPASAFPHIFILYEGEPFDTQLEAITLITGAARLQRLIDQIRVCGRQTRAPIENSIPSR